jgi:teichuronic acid biosynthesis glycosyltransferase TuaH
MSQKQDLIFFSVTRWNQPNPGSSISLLKEFSKHYRVFFVERPYSIRDIFIEWGSFQLKQRLWAILLRRKPYLEVDTGYSNFVVVTPGLSIPVNFLPKGFVHKLFNAINNYIVSRSIRRAIRKYQIKDFIYFNYFNPVIMPTYESVFNKAALNVYYITNDISTSKYLSKHGAEAEQKAIKNTDLILVSSKFHFHRIFQKGLNMHYFPNAVDLPFFESIRNKEGGIPYDLLNIGDTKVLMFCGYISSIRLDYQLIKAVCENFSQYLVVLVGTYDEADLIKYKLDQIPNLIILGNRRYESIPAYIKVASVALIPYLCNDLNQGAYPLKLNEYLAMGKPVVSTNFSTDMQSFKEVVYVANDYEDFLNAIELALLEDSIELQLKRIEMASQNTWAIRTQQFKFLVDASLEKIRLDKTK